MSKEIKYYCDLCKEEIEIPNEVYGIGKHANQYRLINPGVCTLHFHETCLKKVYHIYEDWSNRSKNPA